MQDDQFTIPLHTRDIYSRLVWLFHLFSEQLPRICSSVQRAQFLTTNKIQITANVQKISEKKVMI